jgi:hypothetical protein
MSNLLKSFSRGGNQYETSCIPRVIFTDNIQIKKFVTNWLQKIGELDSGHPIEECKIG